MMHIQTYYMIFLALILGTLDFINAGHKDESVNGIAKKNSPVKKSPSRFRGLFLLLCLLGAVFAGIFIYYFFLCHPILCRKERNYDFVEHSRDTTPTRNTEKTL